MTDQDSYRKIQVLLSSYNGEKYIGEQLDSILKQKEVAVHINVRDDGSKDETKKVLEEYKKAHSGKIDVEYGENIGFAKSFYSLAENSGEYKYFAFSDQDDVWLPDKIIVGVLSIDGDSEAPEMYFCNCSLVDSSLNLLGIAYDNTVKMPLEKHQRILENLATGCTIVFNRAARDMFIKANPEKIEYHDLWMYVICSYFGKVIYDSTPHILYRQHQGNVIGSKPDIVKLWRGRIKQLQKKTHLREYIASEVLRLFGDRLSPDEKRQVILLADYRKSIGCRLRLFFAREMKLPSLSKNFWFKIHVIVGSV